MSWSIVPLSQVRAVPWRNGGGLTRELLAWPNAAQWAVRMSVANVEQDGPFSRFDGVQRWFAVLSGAGVRLRIDSAMHTLTTESGPLQFDGAAEADCALLGGPTLDFNLMVQGRAARMERVRGRHEAQVRAEQLVAAWTAGAEGALVCCDERIALAPMTLAWRIAASDAAVHFGSADGLWMEVAS
ncbi:MAG: HutD family protein [Pseudomonadota bacterium]